jgi:hypothetical protein
MKANTFNAVVAKGSVVFEAGVRPVKSVFVDALEVGSDVVVLVKNTASVPFVNVGVGNMVAFDSVPEFCPLVPGDDFIVAPAAIGSCVVCGFGVAEGAALTFALSDTPATEFAVYYEIRSI